ncbi:glycosyltransferase family 9 protein, partial [Candidatus Poribacteria bacterium]
MNQRPAPSIQHPASSIQHPASSIQNILIFSFSHIGDAVLSTAVIPPLQEHFPDAKLDVLVGPKACKVFLGDVRVDEVIIYDNRGAHAGLGGKLRLIKELKRREFDLIVDLRDSFWSRLIGVSRWGMPLSQRRGSSYKNSHAVSRYLSILSSHGIPSEDAAPEFHLSDSEKQLAADFLSR